MASGRRRWLRGCQALSVVCSYPNRRTWCQCIHLSVYPYKGWFVIWVPRAKDFKGKCDISECCSCLEIQDSEFLYSIIGTKANYYRNEQCGQLRYGVCPSLYLYVCHHIIYIFITTIISIPERSFIIRTSIYIIKAIYAKALLHHHYHHHLKHEPAKHYHHHNNITITPQSTTLPPA